MQSLLYRALSSARILSRGSWVSLLLKLVLAILAAETRRRLEGGSAGTMPVRVYASGSVGAG